MWAPKEQKRERETERGTEIKERENETKRGERERGEIEREIEERKGREIRRHIRPICLSVSSTELYPSQREFPKANLRTAGKVFHTSILCKLFMLFTDEDKIKFPMKMYGNYTNGITLATF